MKSNIYHTPVLLHSCIEGLNIKPDGIYVDVTYGGGGHSREILKRLGKGRLIVFDQDVEAEENKIEDERFTLIRQNFRYMKSYLKMYDALPVDGILADLGVSSHQFDAAERGFSTRYDSALDMRMDRNSTLTAAGILNTYEEHKLKEIFRKYGELENVSRLVRVIAEARAEEEIKTTAELKKILNACAPRGKENQFYAKLFQALRIEVNKELDALKEMLEQSAEVLKEGGRLVVISYHSLEDRLVKNFMKAGNFEAELKKDFFGNVIAPFKAITRKPIIPTEEEIQENNRARSAKLRIAERTSEAIMIADNTKKRK